MALPAAKPMSWLDPRIDHGIIVHPSPSSVGTLPPGKPMMQNQFPNLQLLQIEGQQAKLESIPAQWPNLKLQRIPVRWPEFTLSPVGEVSSDGIKLRKTPTDSQ